MISGTVPSVLFVVLSHHVAAASGSSGEHQLKQAG
jgi:hypothetical protein